MYVNYTTRSLLRGGQRTILAVFCVAVEVKPIVALYLVGLMVNNALTSNVRYCSARYYIYAPSFEDVCYWVKRL